MNKISLIFLLFLAFLAYRLHFWDYSFDWHIFVSSIADVGFSIPCGLAIFSINKKFKGKKMLFLSLILLIGFSFSLFFTHKIIYMQANMLVDDFYYMFHALCFQLLDSCAIVITGALAYLLFLLSVEKDGIQKNLEEMAIAKDMEELKYLKTKINPHFIFNGLNSIYHEIDSDQDFAKDRLIQFSDIVRYHLQYASQEKVNFDVELNYLKSYISFQYQSTSDFLTIDQDYSIRNRDTEIAPLLFIPFLENAFKYCSSSNHKKGEIKVGINFNKDELKMNLINTYDPSYRDKRPSNGFGLRNVVKRLDLHYPGQYDLKIEDSITENIFRCHLQIAI